MVSRVSSQEDVRELVCVICWGAPALALTELRGAQKNAACRAVLRLLESQNLLGGRHLPNAKKNRSVGRDRVFGGPR